MALVPCIECKREISDKAAACPHCGCPVAPAQPLPVNVTVQVPPGLGSAAVEMIKVGAKSSVWGRVFDTVFWLSVGWLAFCAVIAMGRFQESESGHGFVMLAFGASPPGALLIANAWWKWLRK